MPTVTLSSRYLQRAALGCLISLAAVLPAMAAPPSDADVNRLLAASRAQTMIEGMLPQMDAMQRQQVEQFAANNPLTPEDHARLQQVQQRMSKLLREALTWSELRPMYVELYKQSFSKEDVLAMAEFYESSAGQSLLDKTPQLMHNTMQAIQKRIEPLMAEFQKDLQEIEAKGSSPAGK